MKIEENVGGACVLNNLFLGREEVVRLRLLSGLTALRLLSLVAPRGCYQQYVKYYK